MDDINKPTAKIACEYKRWKRNRDFIVGEYAVKGAGKAYLSPADPNMSDVDYLHYNENVVFYPAASRTCDGLTGLVFRKDPVLTAKKKFMDLAGTVTADGLSYEDLAQDLFRETLTTNYSGILVDTPFQPAGLSAAQAEAGNYRPFAAPYRAESILEISTAVIANRKVISRVRLLEDDKETVRELTFVQGVYAQNIWVLKDGEWRITDTVIPTVNGKSLSYIPFFPISDNGRPDPRPATLDHSVNLNLSHFRLNGYISSALRYLSAPIPYAAGLTPIDHVNAETGEVTQVEPPLSVTPGILWTFADKDTKVGYLEFSGSGMAAMRAERDAIEGYMATVGARILSSDKAAAEAAETLAIRRSSENSVLASSTRIVSRQIEAALQCMSDWVGMGKVSFALNTDYLPSAIDATQLTALTSAWLNGAMSYESLFFALQQGEILDPALTIDEERARINLEKAQAPSGQYDPNIDTFGADDQTDSSDAA